jgi:phytol kinase
MVESVEVLANLGLLALCYLYIVVMIVISIKLGDKLLVSIRRKFLHILIGNFVFIIPFFTLTTFPLNFPFFVASPFVLVTFLATPLSPINFNKKINGLTDITTGGHEYGLFFYAISYTLIALFFAAKPYVIIAGILPMTFGDAAASLVGQKLGHHKMRLLKNKSIEGSFAMFVVTFVSVTLTLLAFSYLFPFNIQWLLVSSFVVSVMATVLEAVTPKGLDNLTVPIISAVLFLLMAGGI